MLMSPRWKRCPANDVPRDGAGHSRFLRDGGRYWRGMGEAELADFDSTAITRRVTSLRCG